MTDDARERFLREITAHVPVDRIAELHLFRPLRRGPTETGVAVIAVEQEGSREVGSPDQAAASTPADVVAREAGEADVGPYAPDAGGNEAVEFTAGPAGGAHMRVVDTLPGAEGEPTGLHAGGDLFGSASTAGGEEGALALEIDDMHDAELSGAACSTEDVPLSKRSVVRHTVFTARYRLTRKGAERGKWEFEVVADADAPLGTVDTVVRGVQRRAGDDDEPERLTAEGVRAALDGQAWQRTT